MERMLKSYEELEDLMQECVSYEFNGLSGQCPDYKWYSFIMEDGTEIQGYIK